MSHPQCHTWSLSITKSVSHSIGVTHLVAHPLSHTVFDKWCQTLGITQCHILSVTLSDSPTLHTVSHDFTSSVSHSRIPAAPQSVSQCHPQHRPGSHKLPPPPPPWVQSPELLPHVKAVSCCCAQSPQPLPVPSRISCCQGPSQAWPSLGTQPKAQEPAGWQEPWAPLPAPVLAGPVGFSPVQSTWIPRVPGLVLCH